MQTIPKDKILRVMNNFKQRVATCFERGGKHIEHKLLKQALASNCYYFGKFELTFRRQIQWAKCYTNKLYVPKFFLLNCFLGQFYDVILGFLFLWGDTLYLIKKITYIFLKQIFCHSLPYKYCVLFFLLSFIQNEEGLYGRKVYQ